MVIKTHKSSKIVKSLATLLVLGLTIFSFTGKTFAATLDEILKQKDSVSQQLKQKQEEAARKQAQAEQEKKTQAQLQSSIQKIDKDINGTENRINQTTNQITRTQDAIGEQQTRIAGKETDIERKKVDIMEAATEHYIQLVGQGNEIYTVLGSSRISEALDGINALSGLSDKLALDAENLEKERQDYIAAKASLEQKQADLNNQKSQLAAYQDALDNQKAEKSQLVQSSKQAQQQFISEANQAIKASQELKNRFAAISNEEAAMRRSTSQKGKATASRNSSPSKQGFVWPVDGTITTYFGGNTPFQNYHTGLDIAGPAGDAIVAAQSGKVTTATLMCCDAGASTVDKSYGYGNWIEIQHDNGYVTRYGHLLKMLVSPGQHVERGQVIAYRGGARGMAGAGWSTGAHTHFEVWDREGPFNPLDVLP